MTDVYVTTLGQDRPALESLVLYATTAHIYRLSSRHRL